LVTRNRLISWLLAMLAALGVIVVVVNGPSPTPVPTATAQVSASPAPSESPNITPGGSAVAPSAVACATTDQNAYVYHASRLKVLAPCIRAEGKVAAMRKEADGDYHILLALDPAYAGLVNAANSGLELGDLVVEPVCELVVTQTDAQAICATDKDPISLVGLKVGEHVWMEGRWVEDLEHGSWRELHPLYSWVGN
jgi:hypothetical protein